MTLLQFNSTFLAKKSLPWGGQACEEVHQVLPPRPRPPVASLSLPFAFPAADRPPKAVLFAHLISRNAGRPVAASCGRRALLVRGTRCSSALSASPPQHVHAPREFWRFSPALGSANGPRTAAAKTPGAICSHSRRDSPDGAKSTRSWDFNGAPLIPSSKSYPSTIASTLGAKPNEGNRRPICTSPDLLWEVLKVWNKVQVELNTSRTRSWSGFSQVIYSPHNYYEHLVMNTKYSIVKLSLSRTKSCSFFFQANTTSKLHLKLVSI